VFVAKYDFDVVMLLVGAQMRKVKSSDGMKRLWRHEFYMTWIPLRLRPLDFTEYDHQVQKVRNDPLMIVMALLEVLYVAPSANAPDKTSDGTIIGS
jgi:hypothetical protein